MPRNFITDVNISGALVTSNTITEGTERVLVLAGSGLIKNDNVVHADIAYLSGVFIGRDELLQQYALQLDEAAGSITYIGEALPGTTTASASWRVKRLDESGDPEVIITWADGDDGFNNIWDNRAALSYS